MNETRLLRLTPTKFSPNGSRSGLPWVSLPRQADSETQIALVGLLLLIIPPLAGTFGFNVCPQFPCVFGDMCDQGLGNFCVFALSSLRKGFWYDEEHSHIHFRNRSESCFMNAISKPNASRPAKFFLWGLVGSVILGAVLGIIFILRDSWGWFEVRVMLTTVIVAVTSLCGLACDLSRMPRGRNVLPKLGLVFAILTAGLLLVGMWSDLTSEGYWKATFCVSIVGVAIVHVCLLSIAKLATRFQWIRFIGSQFIFGFALLLCCVIVGEIDERQVWRLIAAMSIVIAAFSLTVPILHRISKLDRLGEDLSSPIQARNLAAIDDEIVILQKRIALLQKTRERLESADNETSS